MIGLLAAIALAQLDAGAMGPAAYVESVTAEVTPDGGVLERERQRIGPDLVPAAGAHAGARVFGPSCIIPAGRCTLVGQTLEGLKAENRALLRAIWVSASIVAAVCLGGGVYLGWRLHSLFSP